MGILVRAPKYSQVCYAFILPTTRTPLFLRLKRSLSFIDAANNFDRIRKLHGKDATTDVYVRSPLNDETLFWFVGKVIRMVSSSDEGDEHKLTGSCHPTEEETILSQKRLILEYAKNQLRPQNMGGPYSKKLELWSVRPARLLFFPDSMVLTQTY